MLLSWLLYGHTLATIWLHEMSTLFFYTFQVVDYYVYKNKRPLKQLLLQESFIYPKGRTSGEDVTLWPQTAYHPFSYHWPWAPRHPLMSYLLTPCQSRV